MRKKELLTQNIALFEQLEKCRLKIKELEKELSSKNNIIAKLQSNTEETPTESAVSLSSAPINTETETVRNKPKKAELPRDVGYGASIIGKLVISAAKYCNRLALSACENKKDQINLILGGTEVAKAEIFKIVTSDIPYEDKCSQIDAQYLKTSEYFANVFAQ